MTPKILELRERLQSLNAEAHEIRATAEAAKRDLSSEEAKKLDAILDEFDRCREDIDRLEKLELQTGLLSQPQGRKTEPDQPSQPLQPDGQGGVEQPRPAGRKRSDITVPASYAVGPKNGGFASLGEMAYYVARACMKGGALDPRLERLAAATIYGSEASGSDGGFAVPPDFRTAIMEMVMGEESLLSLCDQITVSGNTFSAPVDATTPWQTSGGIQAYWGGEGEVKTQSKPALEERTTRLNKIFSLVPLTEELLEDASAMDSYLRRKAPEKIAFKLNLAIVQGDGVGKPLGILNSPSIVSVAKETGQVADTLIANNVIKMYSRMYGPLRSGAVWLVNQDVEPQLHKLSVPGTDNTGNAATGWGGLVYLPAGGLAGSPFGTLYGRPVIPTQACETLGDKGDIIFVNLSQYLVLLKSGTNPRVETSIHIWFDQDLVAFRFVLRVGGTPWWGAAVSARDGNNSYSWAVVLDERA
jgi:HK97 family phage major capsid protein